MWLRGRLPSDRHVTRANSPAKSALWILAVHNVVQNSILNEAGYVTGNLAATSTLLGLGREAGLEWQEMGLSPGNVPTNLRVAAAALLSSATFLAVVPRIPALRSHLRDERAPPGPRWKTMRRAFVRYPLGTALFEEVAFRGVLPALLATERRSGDIPAALAFAAWHVIPTHHALIVNGIAQGWGSRIAGTLMGSAAAGLAGYALSRVARGTRSILAPWLIHSAVNTMSYLAVVLAQPDDT